MKKIQEEKRKGNQERARQPRPRFSDRRMDDIFVLLYHSQREKVLIGLVRQEEGEEEGIFFYRTSKTNAAFRRLITRSSYRAADPLKRGGGNPFHFYSYCTTKAFLFLETGLSCESGIGSNSTRVHSAIVREV